MRYPLVRSVQFRVVDRMRSLVTPKLSRAATLTVLLAFACTDGTGPSPIPAALAIAAGDQQAVAAGAGAATPLAVRVLDANGDPVSNQAITWTVAPGGGSAAPASSTTDGDGVGSTVWTPGTVAGTYVVTASVTGLATPGTFQETVLPAAPAVITIDSTFGAAATAGAVLSVPIRVVDAYGNGVPNVAVTVTATQGGTLAPAQTTTDAAGRARTTWTLGALVAPNDLQATAGSLAPAVLHVVGNAGPATSVAKNAGDAQTAAPQTAVAVPPSVLVSDANGNPVAGVPVVFSVSAGGGSVTGANVVTGAGGVATVGGWVLGASSGPNALVATVSGLSPVTLTATAALSSADVTVSVDSPLPGTAVGDSVAVIATVNSRFQLASVSARIGAVQIPLALTQIGRVPRDVYVGTVVLQNVPFGATLSLVVKATDVNGSATEAVVPLVHDALPVVTIATPLAGAVARPTVDYSASCVDDDPAGCRSLVAVYDSPTGTIEFARGTSAVGGTLSLAAYEGQTRQVTFVATDSRGRTVAVSRTVYVESSTHLSPLITTSGGTVYDYRAGRAAYLRAADGKLALGTAGGADETVAVPSFQEYVHVDPTGALVVGRSDGITYPLYDWRNGGFTTIAGTGGEPTIDANGRYAIYGVGYPVMTLYRRELATGTNLVIASGVGNNTNSVATNGDVAYWTGALEVYCWCNGATKRVSGLGAMPSAYPVTDGVNVVYKQGTVDSTRIILYDGTNEVLLAAQHRSFTDLTPPFDYQVNNGWAAFTVLDATGKRQVWRRSPAGVVDQVSNFSTTSYIAALGADGTVIFRNWPAIFAEGEGYFAAPPGGAVRRVSSTLGRIVWRDDRFVLLLGNTVFTVTP